MRMSKTMFLAGLFILAASTAAQEAVFSDAIIRMRDGSIFKSDGIEIQNDRLTFLGSDAQRGELNLSDVDMIWAKYGTYALEGALAGGGFMLVIMGLSALGARDTSFPMVDDGKLILRMTGIGVVVGGLIGVLFPKVGIVWQYNRFTIGRQHAPQGVSMGTNLLTFHVAL